MDNLDFSEEEIQEQLAILGYTNIPKHKLHEFKQDLDELIRCGKWKSFTSSPPVNSTKPQTDTFQPSPPAYIKEKVSRCYADVDSGEGFFLHAGKVDQDRRVLTTCQNKDYGWRQGRCDSYAQHSVAPKLHLPPAAPSRLQVESVPEDTLQPPNTDSYASSPDTLERRFIKRKVLRKHKGQSLVCDESVYSEDSALCFHRSHTSAGAEDSTMYKMYNSQWEQDSDDKNSLSSSFWSDGEREEDEEVEEVELEQVIDEEDSKPAAKVEEDEKPELNVQGNNGKESLKDDDDGDEDKESSSCDSPAPSLMTSGYGTYRPEEQEGGDYRDDQDSRGDLSETRDDEEDDQSIVSFGVFDIEPAHERETPPPSALEDDEPEAFCYRGDGAGEEELHDESEDEIPEEQQHDASVVEDEFLHDVDLDEGKKYERFEAEEKSENQAEPDESSSNRDIKFIDSKVDLSWKMYEWEGNLRQKNRQTVSCLEERLAELHVSADGDSETENEDVTGLSEARSSDTDDISMSAFESYIRGMTRTRSDVDLRPKPKSFIRPVMSQKTIKKTDPVAKYFQYKQLWKMFTLPGETDRKALRLDVKERLAYQPPPPKPRRVYVPNTYTVPTEKKRSELRWKIRTDLASGLLPHTYSYRF